MKQATSLHHRPAAVGSQRAHPRQSAVTSRPVGLPVWCDPCQSADHLMVH
ncbi:hypothetical protein [Paenarthrobacter sp. NPDC058040]